MNLKDEQIRLEKEALDISINKVKELQAKAIDGGRFSETNEGSILIKLALDSYSETLTKYFKANLRGVVGRDREYLKLYTYQTERLAFLVLSAVVNRLAFQPGMSTSVSTIARQVVGTIINDLSIEENNRNHPVITAYVDKKYKGKSALYRKRVVAKMVKEDSITKLKFGNAKDSVRVGSNLLAMLLDCTDLIYKYKHIRQGGKAIYNLKLTDVAYTIIDNLTENGFIFYLNYPIFVTPPKPRESFIDTGGYYSYDKLIPFVKSKDNLGILKSKVRKDKTLLEPLINLTNDISKTPWRINRTVIDVMSVIYENQMIDHSKDYMLIGDLPNNQLPSVDELLPLNYDGDNEAYQKLCDNRLRLENELSSVRGKALAIHLALNLAKKYDEYEKIYFTYQVDFRSRLYPLQQLLNPQGSKHIKAMLEFAEGEPLDTEDAYRWFMIHGANCYGYDKELYDDRVRLAEGFANLAKEVADNPLANLEWTKADTPFQFLAWLLEYAQYLEYPDEFVSHLPIALDATCSGIQIYSGVMRDEKGCEAVNVIMSYEEVEVPDDYQLKEGEEWID